MLATLQVFGYCCGVLSSRAIEARRRPDASFRLACAGLVPDHATIARFRWRLRQEERWRRSCYQGVSTTSVIA
jgi:transposase